MLESLGNIAYAKAKSGDVQKAVSIYNGILRSQSSFHKGSREYCETMGLLGYLYVQINENARAEACFSIALEWEEKHLGANHPGVGELKLSLLNAQSNIAPDSLWA